ncbi:hypothetical protein SISSUDRAFT_681818 [Sistotremastrum suecicum HHB10207 ss-3]|uniref:Uncharacterized protein n=1 Tax=Sistotremastrum suecicum HHB10207 ss-3 TaxID=1314776 RepID=A0A166I0M8_9AGAM|nr:hypothetical protein SISSUDRAFT_681818 [Sistotremastrum suecicum HHB10207 ss-3]
MARSKFTDASHLPLHCRFSLLPQRVFHNAVNPAAHSSSVRAQPRLKDNRSSMLGSTHALSIHLRRSSVRMSSFVLALQPQPGSEAREMAGDIVYIDSDADDSVSPFISENQCDHNLFKSLFNNQWPPSAFILEIRCVGTWRPTSIQLLQRPSASSPFPKAMAVLSSIQLSRPL